MHVIKEEKKGNSFTMKKKYYRRVFVFIMFFIVLFFFLGVFRFRKVKQDLKENVIRFHVRANSDSVYDQQQKLKVRDAVIDYISPYMERTDTKEQALEILKAKHQEIQNISEKITGKNRKVRVRFTTEIFPEKQYADYIFPKGIYDAIRLDIGKAKGHNWWCVMFPDLCVTKDEKVKINRKAEKKMEQLLGKKTVEKIRENDYLGWIIK